MTFYLSPVRLSSEMSFWSSKLLFSCSVMSVSFHPHGLQHARLICPPLSPGVCSNSYLLSQWCHPTISSCVTPFSSCPQSFPSSGSFPMSQLFAAGGQSTGASAFVFPVSIQSWFPLGLTCLISLLFKWLSRVFSSTTIQKHHFFSTLWVVFWLNCYGTIPHFRKDMKAPSNSKTGSDCSQSQL